MPKGGFEPQCPQSSIPGTWPTNHWPMPHFESYTEGRSGAWCISCVCGCQVWARVCEKGVDGVLCGAQTHKCPTVLYTGLYCTVLYNITSQPLRQRVVLYIVLYCTLDCTVLCCIILPHNLWDKGLCCTLYCTLRIAFFTPAMASKETRLTVSITSVNLWGH